MQFQLLAVTPQSVMRLLVISYFLALALGLIASGGIFNFMAPVLPEGLSPPIMRGMILFLSALVLIGIFRRPAALILSLLVFFSSYSTLYSGGDISAFWRDLALIGALLMTADFTAPIDKEESWDTEALDDEMVPTPAESVPERTVTASGDARFREDFNIVRAT